MKRPRLILLASSLLTLLAAACSKDDLVPEATQPTDGADGLVEMTFTATAAPATRTTLGEKGADGEYPVLWTSGDEIVVMPAYGRFEKSELEEMKFTTSIEGGHGRDGDLYGPHSAEREWIYCILSRRQIGRILRSVFKLFCRFYHPDGAAGHSGQFRVGHRPCVCQGRPRGW